MIRIHLLVCDWFEGLLPDFLPTFPMLFYDLFDSVAEETVSYSIYDVQKGELPDRLAADELYVITGSRAGAYEDKEWINRLKQFVRRADAGRIPLAGICFGHQLIAEALGGKVEPSPKGWGTGIRRSRILLPEAQPYFPEGELRLFYNHNDQVVALPEGARCFATSGFCENEGFLIGHHILCFQGHPEYTMPYEKHVLDIAVGAAPEVLQRAYETTARDDAMGKEAARWMLSLIP